ncbi:hypothetical protein ACFU7Y_08695 [Kitasatospora sp. NPDC057542]|uniref:hypothetical protein n=1 Tax=Kitasatospora sp. NPDC057542 TaxID=3346162 RepID=UPI0036769EA9
MAKGVTRKAVGSVAARRRARELRSEYEARDLALLEGAEEFLTLQERAAAAVDGIAEQIGKLEAARERVRREGWEQGAVVAARMRGLQVRGVAVREDEVADRLGVEVGELRRMVAHVKASGGGSVAAVEAAGGTAPTGGAQRAVGDGPGAPVAPVAPGASVAPAGSGPGAAVRPAGGAAAGVRAGGPGPGGGAAASGSGPGLGSADGVRGVG